jgi:hypothetical protein
MLGTTGESTGVEVSCFNARVDAGLDPMTVMVEHGILLQSAKGPIPNLADIVAGETIKGSWWGHPRGHDIYAAINVVRDSPDVVAVRLIRGKITLIHRRLWAPLTRLASRFPDEHLAALHEEHTPSGHHRTTTAPFPEWVPPDVVTIANAMSEAEAESELGAALM